MFARLFEITSTLVCWACMPVPAMSSARISAEPCCGQVVGACHRCRSVVCGVRSSVASGGLGQDLVDRVLAAVGLRLHELHEELELARVVDHLRGFQDRLDVGL